MSKSNRSKLTSEYKEAASLYCEAVRSHAAVFQALAAMGSGEFYSSARERSFQSGLEHTESIVGRALFELWRAEKAMEEMAGTEESDE